GARSRGRSAAIPDRPDRRPRPAGTEAAAIVAAVVDARPAEIAPLAVVVAVIAGDRVDVPGTLAGARHAPGRVLLGPKRLAVARRLHIARQEAVAMPARCGLLVGGSSRRGAGCERQNDSNRQTQKARHGSTIGDLPVRRRFKSGCT